MTNENFLPSIFSFWIELQLPDFASRLSLSFYYFILLRFSLHLSRLVTRFGSYDPQLSAFIPMSSLGTAANSGAPINGNGAAKCASNFDNAGKPSCTSVSPPYLAPSTVLIFLFTTSGFVLGTSSCLFTVYNDTGSYIWTAPISPIFAAWNSVNATFPSQPEQQLDIAAYPNPFQGLNAGTFLDSNQTQLRLLDGGEAGENNPLASLIVKARELEVIIVVDASADVNNMPNGQAIIATADRSMLFPPGTQSIPPLPKSPATFIAQGLNLRPTFFGCGGSPPSVHGVPQNSTYP